MRALQLLAVLLVCYVPPVFADEASVTIFSPVDGARLSLSAPAKIDYEVMPGPQGDHTHLYVDGKQAAVLRPLKGTHTLEPLMPGMHDICIRIVNKGHTPIGVQRCIKVSVES